MWLPLALETLTIIWDVCDKASKKCSSAFGTTTDDAASMRAKLETFKIWQY